MAGGGKWTLSADSKKAVKGTKDAAKGFSDLEKTQKAGLVTANKYAMAATGINQALEIGAKILAVVGMAFRRLGGLVGSAVREAKTAQDAYSLLNGALSTAGVNSETLRSSLVEQAAALQRVTTVGDDTAIRWQALGIAMGLPVEKTNEFIEALAGAEAAGIPADTMIRGLSGSMTGQAGTLSRYVPKVRELTEEQMKQGEAIALVRDQFFQLATEQRTTFTGAMASLNNAYTDFLEVLGGIITDSPIVRATILELSDALLDAGEAAQDGADNMEAGLGKMILQSITLLEEVAVAGLRVKQVFDGARIVLVSFQQAALTVSVAVQRIFEMVIETTVAALEKLLPKQLKGYTAAVKESFAENSTVLEVMQRETGMALDQAVAQWSGYGDAVDDVRGKFEEFRQGVIETAGTIGANGAGLLGGGDDGGGGDGEGGGINDIIVPLSHATEIVMDYSEFINKQWSEIVGHLGKATGAFNTMIGKETTFFKILGGIVQKLQAFMAVIESIKAIAGIVGKIGSLPTGGFNPLSLVGGVGDRGLMPMVVADQGATAMPGMGSHSLVMRRNDEMVMDPTGTSTVTRMLKWFENNVSNSSQSLRLGGAGGGGGFTVVDDRPILVDGREVFRLFEERSFDANRGGRGVMADGAYEVAR